MGMAQSPTKRLLRLKAKPFFLTWTLGDALHVARFHWMPCAFALGVLFFMAVEYTILMVPSSAPPLDLGFIATRPLHRLLSSSPQLNTLLAFLNTVPKYIYSFYFISKICLVLRRWFGKFLALFQMALFALSFHSRFTCKKTIFVHFWFLGVNNYSLTLFGCFAKHA